MNNYTRIYFQFITVFLKYIAAVSTRLYSFTFNRWHFLKQIRSLVPRHTQYQFFVIITMHIFELLHIEWLPPQWHNWVRTWVGAFSRFLRTYIGVNWDSPSDGEISPLWFISPCLSISAYNLYIFNKFSNTPLQNSLLEIFCNTPISFVFCVSLFKKLLLKDVCWKREPQ